MMSLSVGKNAALMSLAQHAIAGFIYRRRESLAISDQVSALSIKAPTTLAPVRNLSGGNQQKVVLARCLMSGPGALLADEPTQGVDAGARFDIYSILRAKAAEGVAVVVASADALELAGLCDRVLVFSRGTVVKELSGEAVTEKNITEAALTSIVHRKTLEAGSATPTWLQTVLHSQYAPSLILLAIAIGLGCYAAAVSPFYLTQRNLGNVLILLTPLLFIALGQMAVLLSAGIDLSVGPLAGLTAVICSFFLVEPSGPGGVAFSIGLALTASIAVGSINWLLIRKTLVTPVIATLVTFMCIRGSSLWLRSIPDGIIDARICDWLGTKIGPVPVAFVIAVLATLVLEIALRTTRWGLCLRAVGSSEANARKAGVPIEATYLGAYVLCSALTFAGSLMLMAQIGVGDPGAGVNYTLTSITAVVLGGASLFGGRGSFVGAFMGAVLIQQIMNVTTFIKLDSAWQFWLIGILIIGAALLYSGLRARRGEETAK